MRPEALAELPADAIPPVLSAGYATGPVLLARFLDPVHRQQMFVLFCPTRACGGMSMNMGADQRTPTFPYLPFIPADGAEPCYAQWADFVLMGLRQPLLPEVLEPVAGDGALRRADPRPRPISWRAPASR